MSWLRPGWNAGPVAVRNDGKTPDGGARVLKLDPSRSPWSRIDATNSETVGSRSHSLRQRSTTPCGVADVSIRAAYRISRRDLAADGVNSFHTPSDITSTRPSTTLMAVWSSMA